MCPPTPCTPFPPSKDLGEPLLTAQVNPPFLSGISIKDSFISILMVTGVLPTCMSVLHMRAVPAETRRGHHILWHCSYRQLLIAMWVLEIMPTSSRRPVNDLDYRAITAAPPSGILTLLSENLYVASASHT